jgi:hypothetical protein
MITVMTERSGRKRLSDKPPAEPVAAPRIPHIARLMALAIKFQGMLRDGLVSDNPNWQGLPA